jgi:hypothetical protein
MIDFAVNLRSFRTTSDVDIWIENTFKQKA